MAVIDFSNDDCTLDKLSEMGAFTDITNTEFEVLTSIYFDSIDPDLLKSIELYYICYDLKNIQMEPHYL